jgi:hypothetical protein
MTLDEPSTYEARLVMTGRLDYEARSAPIDVQSSRHMTLRQAQDGVAPIPLPPSALLLAGAFGLAAALRGRRG